MKNKITKILGGAAVLGAAVTPVAALASCTKTPKVKFDVIVDGATYDAEKSNIRLNQDSTIVLIDKQGYEVVAVTSLIVGTKELSTDDYSFDAATKTITIKAAAMTATSINITVYNDTVDAIAWKDGWYAYQVDRSTATVKTNKVFVRFDLKTGIVPSGATLYYAISTKSTTTPNRAIGSDVGTVVFDSERKIATINQYMVCTQGSIMNIGDHVDYDITFICTKNDELLWSHTITDCYFYLFCNYKFTTFLDTEQTGYKAKAEFYSNVNVDPKLFGKVILAQTKISNIKRSAGVASDIEPVLEGDVKPTSQQHLQQTVKFNKTDSLNTGDYVTFDLTLYLALAELPEEIVSFKGENLKLTYTKK